MKTYKINKSILQLRVKHTVTHSGYWKRNHGIELSHIAIFIEPRLDNKFYVGLIAEKSISDNDANILFKLDSKIARHIAHDPWINWKMLEKELNRNTTNYQIKFV